MKDIKITERGWAGHFVGASYCGFRRNTLIEYGDKRIVVSTVGQYRPDPNSKCDTIGIDRYYETMAFEAKKDGVYWDANVRKEIEFNSNWAIREMNSESDLKANEMHEAVVAELSRDIITDNIKFKDYDTN